LRHDGFHAKAQSRKEKPQSKTLLLLRQLRGGGVLRTTKDIHHPSSVTAHCRKTRRFRERPNQTRDSPIRSAKRCARNAIVCD